MCFLKDEKLKNYRWLIEIYKILYQHMNASFSEIWIFDEKLNISIAIVIEISFNAKHILCLWHIEKNVIDNCKKYFIIAVENNEIWKKFMNNKNKKITDDFRELLYINEKYEFDLIWQNLQNKYNNIKENICIYLINEILSKRQKWNKTWTD